MSKPIFKMSAKLSPMVLALALAFPLTANAANKPAPKPTTEQLQAEIDLLKTQVAELKKMVMEKAATPAPVIVQAPPAPPPAPSVDVSASNRTTSSARSHHRIVAVTFFRDASARHRLA